ncbi:MAG: heavy-metal-associated domain-containing protein [[Eubacterium] sulci]|jgi:hypothetical protein|nr:heavy-metal-associated domain-containing protein [[Eubacterium] sulci]
MKVTLKVEGMSCGMCEAHVCETIRKAVPDAKKIKASKRKGTATFVTDSNPNEYELAKAIEETGYTCTGMDVE